MKKGITQPLIIALILLTLASFIVGAKYLTSSHLAQTPAQDITDASPASPSLPSSPSVKPGNQNNSSKNDETKPSADLEITLDSTSFKIGQTISGQLDNKNQASYFASSGRFGCTIYGLEMKNGSIWKDVSSCASTSPVGKITVVPGITPFNIAFSGIACSGECGLSKGTYRLSLIYSDTSNFDTTKTIYSPEFEIR